ncbi:MAG: hypothetical protein AUJ98_11400 [Bacteroidetes bacterium CG2_30_33_31]|nr:MAG: hypothetical protein AUJ98_11400 [Bacteroidetes bacterium CG2_30_33_31]
MRVFTILFFLIFFLACSSGGSSKVKKPEIFLNEEELIEVIVDFRLTEATIRQIAGYGEDTRKLSRYYYDKMLKKHGLTAEDYKRNLKYYSQNPDEIHDIYAKVVVRLSEMQTQQAIQK